MGVCPGTGADVCETWPGPLPAPFPGLTTEPWGLPLQGTKGRCRGSRSGASPHAGQQGPSKAFLGGVMEILMRSLIFS